MSHWLSGDWRDPPEVRKYPYGGMAERLNAPVLKGYTAISRFLLKSRRSRTE